jgi:hypothetical protein
VEYIGQMRNFHYLLIALLILLLIGLFGNVSRYKSDKAKQTQPQQSQPASSSTTVVIANGQSAPKKYGYVPPPAYNPYKNQYYNN